MAPEKTPEAFRTISEVAAELDVPQHVLRFWETRFNQVRPLKRAGGRRYYRPEDVLLLKGIRRLLYGEGYTIRGAQQVLRERGVRHVCGLGAGDQGAAPAALPPADSGTGPESAPAPGSANGGPVAGAAGVERDPPLPEAARAELAAILSELMELQRLLDASR